MVKHTIDSAQLAKKLDYFSDNFEYYESHAISYGLPQKRPGCKATNQDMLGVVIVCIEVSLACG